MGVVVLVAGCASATTTESKSEPSRPEEKKPSGTYGNY
jgi:hypothetical protein